MTEKLYYKDAYLSEFYADVISVEEKAPYFEVVLDKTAFFPEEGGQGSDCGYISDARVLSVKESSGVIYHYADKVPSVLTNARCVIDFDKRFEKMQIHTAEHLVCGILHKLYGYENVGFHLGEDVCTFDINAELTREVLDEAELLANEAIYKNLEVTADTYSADELQVMQYRSKLEIFDGMRIVKIGDMDSCACCAPHVKSTGEIGVIKLLDFEKHRGGTRIILTAGRRAYKDYSERYRIIKNISGMLSEPQSTVDIAVDALLSDKEAVKYEHKTCVSGLVKALADSVPEGSTRSLYYIEGVSADVLRDFCNLVGEKSAVPIVALSGADKEYRYVTYDKRGDVTVFVKAANSALAGRGGGRGKMAQGTFHSSLTEIEAYFK